MPASTKSPRFAGLTGSFRAAAYVEAATYLVLLSAVVVYRVLDGPDFVRFLGPIHGLAFLAYLVLVLRVRTGQGWGVGKTLLVLFASAVPFGGFWAARDVVDDGSGASTA